MIPPTTSSLPDKKTLMLSEIPSGTKLKYVNSVDDIIEAASLIEFKTVRKAGTGKSYPRVGKVTLENDKNLKVAIEYFSDGTTAFVTITPAGTGEGQKAASELASRTQGWEFEVPHEEVSGALHKRADLLEDASS
ncbi:MAG: hypothetical protein R3D51_18195 [Hyphomicrobiaceae bacterium]